MKQFKFFQKPVKGDLTMLDGQTRASASFVPDELPPLTDWDTPQGHNHRRMLYHTNPAQYEIQRQIREELRTRLREGGFTEEERIRYRNDAYERMRNTNDDMERYFIENSFRGLTRDLNDNRVEPPVIKPKSKISKFIDWCLNNTDMILYGVGVTFALSIIATFMIYFK
jgi:hypothetical protein